MNYIILELNSNSISWNKYIYYIIELQIEINLIVAQIPNTSQSTPEKSSLQISSNYYNINVFQEGLKAMVLTKKVEDVP